MRQIMIGLAGILGTVLLTGCATQIKQVKNLEITERAHTLVLSVWPKQDEQALATVHCSGGHRCQFTTLNHIQLIDRQTGRPTEDANRATVLRYESMSKMRYAPYYLAVAAGLHELRVQFYPITLERAEQFTLIHDFKSGRQYQLNLFRDRQPKVDSLLSMAAPDPLCVDLIENTHVIRRFCRPFDPETGLGEFIEAQLPSQMG
ncbi:MAG: hypothetical protein VXW65_09705 [Pseudomonadota bacterium]|nr:hypothetical protein [Pseudomonadota bacterium]